MAYVNSLALWRFGWNCREIIFKVILVIDGQGISFKIALKWMTLDFTDDKSTLVQVMAWCHQVTSHYLSQCWTRSMSPYGITRPQWVNRCINCCICCETGFCATFQVMVGQSTHITTVQATIFHVNQQYVMTYCNQSYWHTHELDPCCSWSDFIYFCSKWNFGFFSHCSQGAYPIHPTIFMVSSDS